MKTGSHRASSCSSIWSEVFYRVKATIEFYTLQTGELVVDYSDGRPYPSQLRLGGVNGRAIHIAMSQSPGNGECYVVTAYYPSLEIWDDDSKTRRS